MLERLTCIFRPALRYRLFGVLSLALVLSGVEWVHAFTVLDNFEEYGANSFPSKWRSRSDEGRNVYRIDTEKRQSISARRCRQASVQIGLEHRFDPKQQRRVTWRWRVRKLPVGADERSAEKHDAAAQVYVVFDNQFWPRVIKYVWSASLPVGTSLTNPLYSRGRVVVLRNGQSDKNKWYDEEVNFLDDYRKLFGADPGKVQGIGILTSSDSTKSVAAADYDDFVLLP